MTSRRKVKWLIAHHPQYLFVRTAEAFRSELEKIMPGKFDIEILTMADYIQKYDDIAEMRMVGPVIKGLEERERRLRFTGNGSEKKDVFTPVENWRQIGSKWQAIFKAMNEGKIDLSQTQVSIVAAHLFNDMDTLDMPFIFDSHEECTNVVDGEIGEELLSRLGDETGVRGLAFTYSGGYRVIGSNHGITSVDELAQVPLAASTRPTFTFFNDVGAKTLSRSSIGVDDYADLANNSGAVETTYLRFTGKHVLKTDHSMFLTTILTGSAFWESLTAEEQAAFKIAAKIVAKIERLWSVEDADKFEQKAQENGVTIHNLNAADREKLVEASLKSRSVIAKNYTEGLVERILAANGKTL
jgi:TRAP-type C4-dicarboxylate transport system substrate-binding protein